MFKPVKFLLTISVVVGSVFVGQNNAHALNLMDVIDFGGIIVTDTSGAFWIHNINDDLGGMSVSDISITNATLSVTYSATDGTERFAESWFLLGFGALLPTPAQTPLTTDYTPGPILSFILQSVGFLPVVPAEFTLNLPELFGIPDFFILYTSKLSAEYEKLIPDAPPIPEPASVLMLSSGLAFAFWRRKTI